MDQTTDLQVNYLPEQDQSASESTINSSTAVNMRTATSLEQPSNSMVISPPFLQTHSVPQIYRTSSLPGGMNEEGVNETVHISSPVQLRLSTSRLRRKAQYLRNSVAVTNSDYLNQWKPHMMHYQSPGGGGGLGLLRPTPSAPSLDTISEHELVADFQPKAVPLSPLVTQQQLADPNMFRYTSTPVLDPPRQVIPRPLSSSRPTTPVPPSVALESRPNTPPLLSPSTGYYRPFSVRRESSRAIPLSSHMENQFLPVYINPETGAVFMFEDGYYIPLVSKQIRQLQGDDESAGAAVTQPPVSDKRVQDVQGRQGAAEQQAQRYSRLFQDIPDYLRFVQLLLILLALCCDFAVLLIFGLPALICSIKVRKANRMGDHRKAKEYSEYTLCFAIGGIMFHIILVMIVITMFLMLHFIVGAFSS